jgi:Xaa-Pro aminopeptidase
MVRWRRRPEPERTIPVTARQTRTTLDDFAGPDATELEAKGAILRGALERHGLGGIRLRGQDWFAWATCGGSNAVLLASERGIAEVLASRNGIQVVTTAIEADRLRDEELPAGLAVVPFDWARPEQRERLVHEAVGDAPVASDLPVVGEVDLPDELVAAKRRLGPAEVARYRELGTATAEALTETLAQVDPASAELDVAGIGARALLERGIEPALIMVAGSRRLDLYRHPRPTAERIGDRVSVIFCGRRHGLYANLTRFAYFRAPTASERSAARVVALVEAAAWSASTPGATLGQVYSVITDAYARLGHAGAEGGHHQGGITGYLSREVLAMPDSAVELRPPVALAWNPSLPGTKIEDTILRTNAGIEVLTVDQSWPAVEVEGRARPDLRIVS